MSSIENQIKNQYVKFFKEADWEIFKEMADYYLQSAVYLKKKDIQYIQKTLLVRNIQKRLFIGLGCELLIKSLFLKKGYCINKPKNSNDRPPFRIDEINMEDFNEQETYTFNQLIDFLSRIPDFSRGSDEDRKKVILGLKIAKVFRNKEGHVIVPYHTFDASNYTYIENALVVIYKKVFHKQLRIRFSVEHGEEGIFEIESLS
jgi:hypothetical protein